MLFPLPPKTRTDPGVAQWGSALLSSSRNPGQEMAVLRVSELYPLALIARPFSSYLFFSFGQGQFETVSTAFRHQYLDFKWVQVGRKLREPSGNGAKERSLEVS